MKAYVSGIDTMPDELENISDERVREVARSCLRCDPESRPTANELMNEFEDMLGMGESERAVSDCESRMISEMMEAFMNIQKVVDDAKKDMDLLRKDKDLEIDDLELQIDLLSK